MVDLQIGIALPYNFSLIQRYNYHLSSFYRQNQFMEVQYQTEDPPPSFITKTIHRSEAIAGKTYSWQCNSNLKIKNSLFKWFEKNLQNHSDHCSDRRRDKVNYKRASLLKNNLSEFLAYIHKQQIFHKHATICYVMNSYCSLHDWNFVD